MPTPNQCGDADTITGQINNLDPQTIQVLWAAMCSMVDDNHSPQDNLSREEWWWAVRILHLLNERINEIGAENVLRLGSS